MIDQFVESASLFLVKGEVLRIPFFQELFLEMSNFPEVLDKTSLDVA